MAQSSLNNEPPLIQGLMTLEYVIHNMKKFGLRYLMRKV